MNELYKDYGLTEDQYLDLIKPYQVLIHEIYKQQNAIVSIDPNVLKDFNAEEFIKLSNNIGVQFIQTEIPFVEALKVVCETLNKDTELYRAYKDNIAMAFKDVVNPKIEEAHISGYEITEKDIHEIANQAAKNFLDLLIK